MEKINKPKRVYCEDELDINIYSSGGFWNIIYIDDEEDKINKVFNHLKSATDYKVYCSERIVEFTCKTEKFGYVQCSYQRGRDYMFFCFGTNRSHTRYEICYGIKNAEFKEWLRKMFKEIEIEYNNDKNL